MKFKKIVGFGDSWTWGDELLDPELARIDPTAHPCFTQNQDYRESNCFIGLLGKHYNVPTENHSLPGGSLQSEMWTFLWWLEQEPNPEECLVLVGHTDADRMSFYNPNHVSYSNDPPWNRYVNTAWVHATDDVVSRDWKELFKRYIALSSCSKLNRLNYHQATLMFDGIAARRNIPMLQFNIMSPPPDQMYTPTVIWPDDCLMLWLRHHPENQKGELLKPDGHPNELGHQFIRDRLISEIDMLY